MFRHVVMFRWRTDASAEQIDALTAGLAALPEAVEEIREYRFGPDHGLGPDNWDYVVVADFADREDYLVYRDHDDHQALIADLVRPVLADRASVQVELSD